MTAVREMELPDGALLARYRDLAGCYTDCFAVDVAGEVELAQFVAAFYTTWLFKLERLVLAVAAGRPSTDAQAMALARGGREHFAVWDVEGRQQGQILLCDMAGSTRSWLMAQPCEDGTRLYFGSAVVARRVKGSEAELGWGFRALLPLHRIYAVSLLRAAARRVKSSA
jgi:hypothetical protein